ncbi:inlA [Symbiodinium sp. CCMP2456]|nr:inlA [Symbiodinium sp. CCMP2456]
MGALTVLAFCVLASLLAAERAERHLQVHRADAKPSSRTHIEEVAAGSATRLGAATSECTGPEALRSAFLELGIPAEELAGDPCYWPGAGCDSRECVVEIDLSGRPLSGRVGVLPRELDFLDLSNTKVHGNTSALQHLTHLMHLDLDNTQVAGDLQPLAPLTQLQALYLDNTQVAGDLQPLAPLTQLQHLRLLNTQVVGNLQPLAPLTQLQELYLSNTQVAGDLQPLAPLTQLQDLRLLNTQVAGNLQPLAPLTQLQKLFLSNTQVAGDLQPLAPLTQLQVLGLSNTQVAGDLKPLAPLTQLQDLGLSNTQVAGDLQPLAPLTHLQFLYLSNTQVAGHLQPLAPLTQLQVLYLANTQVAGDLQPLAPLTQLQVLSLANTQVAGDLQPLAPLTRLQELRLLNTQVAGDLKPLAPLTQLQRLDLSDTQVAGDLKPLAPLTQLQELYLSNTQVAGELQQLKALGQLQILHLSGAPVKGQIERLTDWPNLTEVDLSSTQVHGRLDFSWRGSLRKLATLNLAGSQAEFLPSRQLFQFQDFFIEDSSQRLLPALMTLDVSKCPLNGPVADLLMPLAASGQLTRLLAKSANLSGHVPDIACLKAARVDGRVYNEYCGLLLAKSLQALDLSGNKITGVDALKVQTFVSLAENPPITFANGTLQSTLDKHLQLDLTGTAITNTREIAHLLETRALQMTSQTTSTNATGGYSCHDVTSNSLRVSSHLFWPEGLCGCTAGYEGSSTHCSECGPNTFNAAFNSSCRPCPANSTAGKGTASIDGCRCDWGRMIKDACQCDAGKALSQSACEDCSALHLDCPVGSTVHTAKPQVGYARLVSQASVVFRCLDPAAERCSASGSSDMGCTTGYEGPLCVACSEGYRSRSRQCIKCDLASDDTRGKAAGVATTVAVVAVVAGGVYFWRSRAADSGPADAAPVPQGVLQPLLLAQGPVLLQLFQLWGVLVALSTHRDQGGGGGGSGGSGGVWEEEYVQWLQMTAKGFRDAMSLECAYGRSAQSLSALASPCIPLLLLALCMPLEAVRHGAGVSSALKLLTALFIGGASSCTALLSCRQVDGGGEPLLEHAFRVALPLVTCDARGGEAAWADGVGMTCAVMYGLVIPGLLLYLILKQHRALELSRRFAGLAEEEGDLVKVRVEPLWRTVSAKDQESSKHLMAAAAAHCLLFSGRVRLQLQKGHVILQSVESKREQDDAVFNVTSATLAAAFGATRDADMRRCQSMTRMLTERCVLEEVAHSDRVLAGAKELLFKYAMLRDVWFEVAMKFVAVILVAVASTESGLKLTLCFTLATAIAVGTLQPYRQRQVNDLQCFCFICLAAASIGFARGWVALARGALAAPFLLAGVQVLRPDGLDALALRLFKEVERHWPALEREESVELLV